MEQRKSLLAGVADAIKRRILKEIALSVFIATVFTTKFLFAEETPLEASKEIGDLRLILKINKNISSTNHNDSIEAQATIKNISDHPITLWPTEQTVKIYINYPEAFYATKEFDGGYARGGGPQSHESVVVLQPQKEIIINKPLKPTMKGEAQVSVIFFNSLSGKLTKAGTRKTGKNTQVGIVTREKVDGMWDGYGSLSLPVKIEKGGGIRAEEISRKLSDITTVVRKYDYLTALPLNQETVASLLEVIEDKELDQESKILALQRLAYFVDKGIGYEAIPAFIKIAENNDAETSYRLIALDVLYVILSEKLGIMIDIENNSGFVCVPAEIKKKASTLLKTMSEEKNGLISQKANNLFQKIEEKENDGRRAPQGK